LRRQNYFVRKKKKRDLEHKERECRKAQGREEDCRRFAKNKGDYRHGRAFRKIRGG